MKNLKALKEERGTKLAESRALIKKAEDEKRELTSDEETRFDALTGEIADLDKKIVRAEQAEAVRAAAAGQEGDRHGLSEGDQRDVSKYSFLRALNAKLNDRPLEGIEAEMHQEGLRHYREAGLTTQGNLIIPQLVLNSAGATGQRTMTATGQTTSPGDQGGLAIQTNVGSFIERLRARLVVASMGATQLSGLVGNLTFPKFIADDQAADKGENETANKSNPTVGQVSLAPRRLPVFTEVSRQLLLQTSPEVEGMLRDDLAFQLAQVMDRSAINAILAEPGIGQVIGGANGAAPTWENIVALETAISALDADYGNLGYLTNPKVRGKLKTTAKMGNTIAQPIWEQDDTLNGYRTGVSTLVPSTKTKGTSNGNLSSIVFGNFRDLIQGQWGGIEFLVNPYAKDTEGLIRINAWTFYDEVIRRAQSFAVMQDAQTA
jgi:HK97 family phage major capsid protein